MPAGRPSMLTPEVSDAICEALRKGNYRSTAAASVGIHRTTLYAWEKRGEAGDEPYASFVVEMQAAEAHAEMALLDEIRTAQGAIAGERGADMWQSKAWLLERRFASRWCQRVKQHQLETEDAILRRLKAKPELHAEVANVLAAEEDSARGPDAAH